MAFDFNSFGGTPTQQKSGTPAPTKKSGGFDFNSFGNDQPVQQAPQTANPSLFGNPLETIKSAGENVYNAITGQGQYTGVNPVERGFRASETAALAIPQTVADVLPAGKEVLNAVSQGFGTGMQFAGDIHYKLADVATKLGLMTPEERKAYDLENADFASSPVGRAINSAASIGEASGNISNVILGAHGTAQGIQDIVDNKIPALKQEIKTQSDINKASKEYQLVQDQANEIGALESSYAKGRKLADYSKDAGNSSRLRISQSNVLRHAVDENGKIRTTQQGGPVEQYKAMTVDPAESVVRDNLVREGGKTNVSEIRKYLTQEVQSSGLKGADLQRALRGVEAEVNGLRLDADPLGNVPNEVLQDAKLNQTKNVNYQTPPEVSTVRKAYARAYKKLIEDNTHTFDVKAVNDVLSKYYEDIGRLESMDGYRVQGGRLGKYAAQIAGTVAGGSLGSILGPVGIAVGAPLGAELSALIKGKSMAGTFKDTGTTLPKNPTLQNAIDLAKKPRPALPAPRDELRSQINLQGQINLPAKSASTIENAQLNSLGSRNTSQSTPAIKTKTAITPNATPIAPKVKPKVGTADVPSATTAISVLNDTLYHGADATTAQKIKSAGFQASKDAPGYGMVNLTSDKSTASNYANLSGKGEILNVSLSHVPVGKIKVYSSMKEYLGAIDKTGLPEGKAEMQINAPYDVVIVQGQSPADTLILAKPSVVNDK